MNEYKVVWGYYYDVVRSVSSGSNELKSIDGMYWVRRYRPAATMLSTAWLKRATEAPEWNYNRLEGVIDEILKQVALRNSSTVPEDLLKRFKDLVSSDLQTACRRPRVGLRRDFARAGGSRTVCTYVSLIGGHAPRTLDRKVLGSLPTKNTLCYFDRVHSKVFIIR